MLHLNRPTPTEFNIRPETSAQESQCGPINRKIRFHPFGFTKTKQNLTVTVDEEKRHIPH